MALKSPLMPSPMGGLASAFSPYTESPGSPVPHNSVAFLGPSQFKRSSSNSDSLVPPSPYPAQVEPSPVDSNGTESTDIEEDAQEHSAEDEPIVAIHAAVARRSLGESSSPRHSDGGTMQKIDTSISHRFRANSNEDPPSVIHAPSGFGNFDSSETKQHEPVLERVVEVPHATVENDGEVQSPREKRVASISAVNTDVPRVTDRSTPRAQTRQEVDDEWKRKSRRTSSLEDIPEANDKDDLDKDDVEKEEGPSTAGLVGSVSMSKALEDSLQHADGELVALHTALGECWTLCNTLASLSSTHRQRSFHISARPDIHEQAWQSCWRLCQKLYESRERDPADVQTIPTLDLCRDFCQSLFEARERGDEASDSVLRVSFELNNHLYNTHDHSLPEAFNERTLDFYITLCHRLMKQPTALPSETDALLRACWSLAEMLFNLRQNQREGRHADEELLGSAVQACWELCDLFREGWKQIRPDRGTPRPSQTTFSVSSYKGSSNRSDGRSSSSLSNRQYHDARALPPETPTTIFDENSSAASSPDSITVPNILVLGPSNPSGSNGSLRGTPHHDRWTSNASVLSGYSESASSQRTSSTATAGAEEAHLARLRYLLLKAGMSTGFVRTSGQSLPTYISALPAEAFGTLPWQMKVLGLYKKLVMNDKSLQNVHAFPARRLGASEVAKSIKWLGPSEQWAWMRDLYRLVFGFGIDEAERRGGSFQV